MEEPNDRLPYDDKSKQVILQHTIVPSIAAVFVVLRFYSRFFYRRPNGWDDWLLLSGFAMVIASEVLICYLTKLGLGKHIWNVDPSLRESFDKILYCGPILYMFAHLFIKNSFLAFYLRLTVDERYRRACWTLLIVNSSFCITSGGMSAFGCSPVSYYWNQDQAGSCLNLPAVYLTNAILNLSMDISILLLPIFMIWLNSPLTFKKKISVSILFLLGGFSCICAIIRLPTVATFRWKEDITMEATSIHGWSNIESNVAVMAGCIPAIKPLFVLLIRKIGYLCSVSVRNASNIRIDNNADDVKHSNPDSSSNPGNRRDRNALVDWDRAFDEIIAMRTFGEGGEGGTGTSLDQVDSEAQRNSVERWNEGQNGRVGQDRSVPEDVDIGIPVTQKRRYSNFNGYNPIDQTRIKPNSTE